MFKAFATLRICSQEVIKSKDYYRSLFGVEPVEELEGFVSFEVGGIRFDICQADVKNPFSIGGSIGYFLVENIEDVLNKAIQFGGTLYRGPLNVKETGRTIIQIKDPQGNIVGFEAAY